MDAARLAQDCKWGSVDAPMMMCHSAEWHVPQREGHWHGRAAASGHQGPHRENVQQANVAARAFFWGDIQKNMIKKHQRVAVRTGKFDQSVNRLVLILPLPQGTAQRIERACVLASRRRRAAKLTATELCQATPSTSAVTSATSLRCLRTLPSPPASSIRRHAAFPEHEATRADCCRGLLAGKGENGQVTGCASNGQSP